jgi:hypothetical protein
MMGTMKKYIVGLKREKRRDSTQDIAGKRLILRKIRRRNRRSAEPCEKMSPKIRCQKETVPRTRIIKTQRSGCRFAPTEDRQ